MSVAVGSLREHAEADLYYAQQRLDEARRSLDDAGREVTAALRLVLNAQAIREGADRLAKAEAIDALWGEGPAASAPVEVHVATSGWSPAEVAEQLRSAMGRN